MSETFTIDYDSREVVAVFKNPEQLEKAAEALIEAGFAPSRISVMGAYEAVKEGLGGVYEPVEKMEDDPRVPQKAFVSKADRGFAEAAVIGAPMYLLGMMGALGVVATGGGAALAIAAALASGATGAGIGALLANAIEKSHAEKLAKDMEAGGLLLWVAVDDEQSEKNAIDILQARGGVNVHAHQITRKWGSKDIPLSDFNPDPFLEPDPS